MIRRLLYLPVALLLVGIAFVPIAASAQEQIGILEFNPGSGGTGNEFDILNITGVNAGLGLQTTSTWVTTSVDLTGLSLSVAGSGAPYDPTTFTLASDGISWDGSPADFTGATSATLTGTFVETLLDINDGTTVTIDPSFSAEISDPTGLTESDYEYITTTTGSTGPSVTPEPDDFILVGTGLMALAGIRRRFVMASVRKFSSRLAGLAAVLAFAAGLLIMPTRANASVGGVSLATTALPSSGLAGVSSSTLTASNFPAGETPSTVTLSFATTCGGTALATEAPTALNKYVGTIYHIPFAVPTGLASGNYYISLAATSPAAASTNCSLIQVTATSTTLASCVPTSSLAVVAGHECGRVRSEWLVGLRDYGNRTGPAGGRRFTACVRHYGHRQFLRCQLVNWRSGLYRKQHQCGSHQWAYSDRGDHHHQLREQLCGLLGWRLL